MIQPILQNTSDSREEEEDKNDETMCNGNDSESAATGEEMKYTDAPEDDTGLPNQVGRNGFIEPIDNLYANLNKEQG